MTITEFLLARIAEDEAKARAAAPWATGSRHEGQPLDWSIHFDRWSPTRVLAECAAKRAIIDHAAYWNQRPLSTVTRGVSRDRLDEVLRALAAVYAAHPDYRQEWAA